MTNVIDFYKPKTGDTSFLCCSCTEEPTPYMVVAIVAVTPLICGLLCPECETQLDVSNGFVYPPDIDNKSK